MKTKYEIEKMQTEMQRNCQDCQYYGASVRCCDYISMVGHSRGCPPGDDCIMKVVGEGEKEKLNLKRLKAMPKDEWKAYIHRRKLNG